MNQPIFCQADIPKSQWRYGLRSSAATGCGWIACYNALNRLGYSVEPEALIRYFERQLPVLHGNFGTSIPGPGVLFRQLGFPVHFCGKRTALDEAVKASDVAILFYRWRKGLKMGAHFVAVEYRDGRFYGYNTYRNSKAADDYGESLQWFLLEKGYFGAIVMGIRDRKTEA